MSRLILRAIDVGASFVFMALCAKAFCTHFYNDLRRASRSLAPSAKIIEFRQPRPVRVRSMSDCRRLPLRY
jgi:hypothetical protein